MAHRRARVAAHLVGSRRAETAAGRAAGGDGRSAPCRPLRGPAEHREPDRMPHRAPGRPPGRRGGFARDLRRCRPPRRRGRRLGGRRRRHARRRTIPGRAPRPAPGDRGRRVAAGGELRRCQQSPSAGGGRPGRSGATGRWRPGRVGRLRAAGGSGPGAVRARRGDRRRQREADAASRGRRRSPGSSPGPAPRYRRPGGPGASLLGDAAAGRLGDRRGRRPPRPRGRPGSPWRDPGAGGAGRLGRVPAALLRRPDRHRARGRRCGTRRTAGAGGGR